MADTLKYANDLLRKHGVTRPPVNAERIAEAENVDVVFVDFNGDAANEVHGYYDAEETRIYVNRADTSEEKLFTIAHELGHHLMHKDHTAGKSYVARLKSHVDTREEREADSFAVNLLVPETALERYSKLGTDFDLRKGFLVTQKTLDAARKR